MNDGADDVSIVLVTAPDVKSAETLALALVEERLAACVNLLPGVTSLYRWEGAVERATEIVMMIKSTAEGFDRLCTRVLELHPYDAPEVVELAVRDGDARYLDWVRKSVGDAT
ncbi:MAG: divalent-cation tolerance protein CutA [Thioalkalivibrio sp.]|nr:divalent-cation tolerance protein CutA [Thioalkalivibrio sp.]